MTAVLHIILKVLEVAGFIAIAFFISTVVAGVLTWATGFLPYAGWTVPDLTLTIGTAMGHAGITMALAAMAFPIVSLIPKLRWLRAWIVAVVLANLLIIAAGINAHMLQNP